MSGEAAITDAFVNVVEAQLRAAQLVPMLANNEYMARCAIAAFDSDLYSVKQPDDPTVGTMLPHAHRTWAQLSSGLIESAVPYVWEEEAARHAYVIGNAIPLDLELSRHHLPCDRGWWWFGHDRPSGRSPLCAFLWDATDEGFAFFPFFNLEAHWQSGQEGAPYNMGPMTVGSLTVPYGVPLREIEKDWPRGITSFLTPDLSGDLRRFLGGCRALERRHLLKDNALISPRTCESLQHAYSAGPCATEVHVVTLDPHFRLNPDLFPTTEPIVRLAKVGAEIVDGTGPEAIEERFLVRRFTEHLGRHEQAARRYLAGRTGAERELHTAPEIERAVASAQQTWSRASFSVAIPYASDLKAVRYVCELARRLPATEALFQSAVPAPVGWWWLGRAAASVVPDGICALLWDWQNDGDGVILHPFGVVGGRGSAEPDADVFKDRVGPLATSGIPLGYGERLSAVEDRWPAHLTDAERQLWGNTVRLFLAVTTALRLGDFTDAVADTSREQCKYLEGLYGHEWAWSLVRTITLSPDRVIPRQRGLT